MQPDALENEKARYGEERRDTAAQARKMSPKKNAQRVKHQSGKEARRTARRASKALAGLRSSVAAIDR